MPNENLEFCWCGVDSTTAVIRTWAAFPYKLSAAGGATGCDQRITEAEAASYSSGKPSRRCSHCAVLCAQALDLAASFRDRALTYWTVGGSAILLKNWGGVHGKV